MVRFLKKGNRKDIKNYRPICVLSIMYKLFTKFITTRLEKTLDENQPIEKTGFLSEYSTTYHIHAIHQINEKCREYNIPLCVAFVDYEKVFDTNPNNIDIIARTRNGKCAYRNPERHVYGHLSGITSAQRE